jgi:hypothetical protein
MRSSNPRIGLAKVDLSLPFRLSGLSASSILELQTKQVTETGTTSSAVETFNEVRVLIESGRGERVQCNFPASTNLSEMLISLIKSGQIAGDVSLIQEKFFEGVSLVYLRSIITGSQLLSGTLESMGIVSGSVKFRLSIPDSFMLPGYNSSLVVETPLSREPQQESHLTTTTTTTTSTETIVTPRANAVTVPTVSNDSVLLQSSSSSSPSSPSSSSSSSSILNLSSTPSTLFSTSIPIATSQTLAPPLPIVVSRDAFQKASMSSSVINPVTAPSIMSAADIEAAEDEAAARRVVRIRSTGRSVRASVAELRAAAFDADAREALETLIKMLDSLVLRPGDLRVRSVRTSNPTFASRVGRFPSTLNILRAVGFKDKEQGADTSDLQILMLQQVDEDDEITLGVREILALEAHSLGAKFPPAPEPNVAHRERIAQVVEQTVQAFDPFKATVLKVEVDPATSIAKPAIKILDGGGQADILRSVVQSASSSMMTLPSSSLLSVPTPSSLGPSSSPHMTEMERKVAGLKARAQELVSQNAPSLSTPESRCTQITFYTPPVTLSNDIDSRISSSSISSSADQDDKMVDIPEERDPEAAKLQLEFMRKRMRQAEKAKEGFHTKAMREAEMLQGAKVFTTALVKVHFPDRTVVQGMFSPQEPVSSIYLWLKDLLLKSEDDEDTHASITENNNENVIMESSVLNEENISMQSGLQFPQFYLYQSPPPTQLAENDTRSLIEARLTPAALLHLGWGSKIGSSSSGVVKKREAYFNSRAFELEAATRMGVRELQYPTSVNVNEISINGSTATTTTGNIDETERLINAAANNLLGGGGGGSGGSGKPSWLKLR